MNRERVAGKQDLYEAQLDETREIDPGACVNYTGAGDDENPAVRGADLAHHLQLVDYIERHWRLVHEAGVEAYLGEMVHYTPGAHLLAAIAHFGLAGRSA